MGLAASGSIAIVGLAKHLAPTESGAYVAVYTSELCDQTSHGRKLFFARLTSTHLLTTHYSPMSYGDSHRRKSRVEKMSARKFLDSHMSSREIWATTAAMGNHQERRTRRSLVFGLRVL